jgi:hypothetical protein
MPPSCSASTTLVEKAGLPIVAARRFGAERYLELMRHGQEGRRRRDPFRGDRVKPGSAGDAPGAGRDGARRAGGMCAA